MKRLIIPKILLSVLLVGCNMKQDSVSVDYEVDTIELKELKEQAFIDNDIYYFIIDDNPNKMQTLIVIDESDGTEHELSVNTKKSLLINNKKVEFIRSKFGIRCKHVKKHFHQKKEYLKIIKQRRCKVALLIVKITIRK